MNRNKFGEKLKIVWNYVLACLISHCDDPFFMDAFHFL